MGHDVELKININYKIVGKILIEARDPTGNHGDSEKVLP